MFTFCALIDQPDIQFITVGIDAKLFGGYIMCFSAAFGAISGNPEGVFQDNFIFNFTQIAHLHLLSILYHDAWAITLFHFICNSHAMQNKKV